jgi:hypothetical protein
MPSKDPTCFLNNADLHFGCLIEGLVVIKKVNNNFSINQKQRVIDKNQAIAYFGLVTE